LNEPVDVSGDFRDFSNLYYLADKLADFDPAPARANHLQRAQYFTRQAFDNMLAVIKPVGLNEFPEDQYAVNPTCHSPSNSSHRERCASAWRASASA